MKNSKGRKEGFNAKAVGKVVDKDIFQNEIKKYTLNYNLEASQVKDRFRLLFGNFWCTLDGEGMVYYSDLPNNVAPLDMSNLNFGTKTALAASDKYPFGVFSEPVFYNGKERSPARNIGLTSTPPSGPSVFTGVQDKLVKKKAKKLIDTVPLGEENASLDHYFTFPYPYQAGEVEESNGVRNPYYYELNSDYNSYVRMYEQQASADNVPESILPNIYFHSKTQTEGKTDTITTSLNSLGGRVDLAAASFKNASKVKDKNEKFKYNYKYFADFGANLNQLVNNPSFKSEFDSLKAKGSVISGDIGDDKNESSKKTISDYASLFPMSVELKWRTDSEAQLINILKKSGYDKLLIQKVIRGETGNPFSRSFKYSNGEELLDYSANLTDVADYFNKVKSSIKGGQSLSSTIFEEIRTGMVTDKDPNAPVSLNASPSPTFFQPAKSLTGVLSSIFSVKISNLVKNNLRSAMELMKGVPAYSEIIGYRIEKLDAKNKTLQNIYITNSDKLGVASYFDTQVKYKKQYKYKVHAIVFVLGTKYWFEKFNIPTNPIPPQPPELKAYSADPTGDSRPDNPASPPEESSTQAPTAQAGEDRSFVAAKTNPFRTYEIDAAGEFRFRVDSKIDLTAKKKESAFGAGSPVSTVITPAAHTKKDIKDFIPYSINYAPSMQIVEIPYFEDSIYVMDNPPMPPDVDIVPYVNIDDRMLFNLNARIETMSMKPVILRSSDQEAFDKFSKKIKNGKLTFKSDFGEPLKAFEIFRTAERPKSYLDFRNSLLAVVDTECRANSASFVDKTIRTNRKYYYTFRAVDVHDHVSNPSPVYEVQLINDAGYIYSIVRTVELDNRIKKEISRSAKKYIYIRPDEQHTVVDPRQFEDSLNIKSSLDLSRSLASAQRTGVIEDTVEDTRQSVDLSGPTVFEPSFNSSTKDETISAREIKNVNLGEYTSDNEQIWDRRFKIRVKSKKTGRIIDFNFKCRKSFKPYEVQQQKKDLC